MGGYAWVTLATNDAYSLGALVLAHSLRRVGTKYELAVLVTPGVTEIMRNNLAAVFSVVQEVNVLDSKDQANLALLARPELGITFTKLHCWRLTQYDKCVFLDADTLVVRNCDELFEREELSAAPDVGWPDCFNSGVFVYAPSQQTFASITAFAAAKGSFDGGDQGLLNMYFSDWAHKDISKHLPFIYNMCATATYSYLPAFKQYGEDVRIIHFIGITKPWLQYFDTMSGIVQPPQNCIHLQPLLQMWWNIFCEKVHPQLSPVMATSTLAPLWHEYVPMHFQSSIPTAPVHTDLCNDICDDAYARKLDFSEFKDPWDDYRIQNVPSTHGNVQEYARENYHCGTESRVYHSCCESLSEPSLEHHNENQNFLDSERQNEFNGQHHAFTQTDLHLHKGSHVENTEANHHDTQFRVDHAPPSNESQHFHHPERNTWEEKCHPHQGVYTEHHVAHDHRSQYHSNSHNKGTSYDGAAEEPRNQHHQHSFEHVHQDVSEAKPDHIHEPGGDHHHCHEYRPSSFDRLSDDQSTKQYSTSDRESNRTPRSTTESHGEHVGSEQRNGQLSINHNAERSDNILVEDQTDTQNVTSLPHSNPCTESRTVATQSDVNVMEHLETEDAGLAGALAQMTLGERRSAEQIALEEHMRKQSWEHGQIDYMGRDSFDNIWKKICETLALASPRSSPPKEVSDAADASADAEKKDKVEVDNPDEAAVHLTQPESVISFHGEQTLVPEYNTDGITVRESNTQPFTDVPEECVTKLSDSINTSDLPLEDNSRTPILISELSREKAPVEVLSCSNKEGASKNLLFKKSDTRHEDVATGERNLLQNPSTTPEGVATTLSKPVSHTETNTMCPVVLDKLVESPIIEKVTDSNVLDGNECVNVADKRKTPERDALVSTYEVSTSSQHSQKSSNQRSVTSSEYPSSGENITKDQVSVFDKGVRTCEQVESSVSETESESASSKCQEASLVAVGDSEAENQKARYFTDPSIGLSLWKPKMKPKDHIESNEPDYSRTTAGVATLAEEKIFGTIDEMVCLTEKLSVQGTQEMLQEVLPSGEAVEITALSDTMRPEFDLLSIAEPVDQSIEPGFASCAPLSQETVIECEATLIARSAARITSPIDIIQSGTKDAEIVGEEVIKNIIEGVGHERESTVPAHRHDNKKRTEEK